MPNHVGLSPTACLFVSSYILLMALVLGSGHSDIPNSNQLQGNGKSIVGRKSANYHPPIWGDRFLKSSLDDLVGSLIHVLGRVGLARIALAGQAAS